MATLSEQQMIQIMCNMVTECKGLHVTSIIYREGITNLYINHAIVSWFQSCIT